MNRFKKIAERAIRDAEAIDCPMEEFQRGLVTIWHEINERLEMEEINPRDPSVLERLEDDT